MRVVGPGLTRAWPGRALGKTDSPSAVDTSSTGWTTTDTRRAAEISRKSDALSKRREEALHFKSFLYCKSNYDSSFESIGQCKGSHFTKVCSRLTITVGQACFACGAGQVHSTWGDQFYVGLTAIEAGGWPIAKLCFSEGAGWLACCDPTGEHRWIAQRSE